MSCQQPSFSIIIPIYKEGKKFIQLLDDIEDEVKRLQDFKLKKVVVIACRDRKQIRRAVSRSSLPIDYEKRKTRQGKANAINLALKKISNSTDLIVLTSGDLSLSGHTLRLMLEETNKEEVGLVTARPIPKENKRGFINYFKNLVWSIHHYLSQMNPKAGEIISFKNVISGIAEETAADEEYIKSLILRKDFKATYRAEAVVYNEGPKTVKKLFEQRKRIYIGHLDLKEREKYPAPSMDLVSLSGILFRYLKEKGWSYYFLPCILFESSARVTASIEYYLLNKNPYIWDKVD